MAVTSPAEGIWSALLGRSPDAAPLPADAGLWQRVRERLNPAKARPHLRPGVEAVHRESERLGPYVMLRSPDGRDSAYVRLHPDEWRLAQLMDGTRTVAQLVGELAKATGRLAPEQVTRVVADLAGGRMLEELPVDAFEPLSKIRRCPWPARLGSWMLAALRGRRFILLNPDRPAGFVYRFGGRLLFTRIGVAAMTLVAIAGLALFLRSFVTGAHQALRLGDSYVVGAIALVLLNVVGLVFHESGHALATKHAGRRVPAAGLMCYFGIPSAFVDTTDLWMAGRRERMVATAAGPGFAVTFAGIAQLVGLAVPELAGVAFALGFAMYLNTLFNLNPLMALDGYYLFADWLEISNLRAKGIAFIVGAVRRPRLLLERRVGEARLVAYYAAASLLWLVVLLTWLFRMYRDRFGSMGLVVWHTGWAGRALMIATMAVLASPLVYAIGRAVIRLPGRLWGWWSALGRVADEPRRVAGLRETRLGSLAEDELLDLAVDARWVRPRRGSVVVGSGSAPDGVLAVVEGELEASRPGDAAGYVRSRAGPGELVGTAEVLGGRPMSLSWSAAGTRLLRIPAATFQRIVAPRVSQRPPTERAEAETLLERAPAFEGISDELRLALVGAMEPGDVQPGDRFEVPDGYAVVVASGTVEVENGGATGAGELLGPPTDGPIRAQARTVARLWRLPVTGGLGLLLGGSPERARASVTHHAPEQGMHGDDAVPLAAPWGPPPPTPNGDRDDRLAKRFRNLLVALLLLAIASVWFATGRGPAWAELPGDTAVLRVLDGHVDAVVDGTERRLSEGTLVAVERDDEVAVAVESLARLEFRGGAEALLCPTTEVALGPLDTSGVDPLVARAALEQLSGRVIVDTEPTASNYDPLEAELTLVLDEGDPVADPSLPPVTALVANDGDARYATSLQTVEVAEGVVTLDGEVVEPAASALACGESGPGASVGTTSETTTTTIASSTTVAPPTSSTSTTSPPTTRPRPRSTTTLLSPAPPPPAAAPPATTTTTRRCPPAVLVCP